YYQLEIFVHHSQYLPIIYLSSLYFHQQIHYKSLLIPYNYFLNINYPSSFLPPKLNNLWPLTNFISFQLEFYCFYITTTVFLGSTPFNLTVSQGFRYFIR